MFPTIKRLVGLSLIPLTPAVPSRAVEFVRHTIDAYPAGYQVAVADINGDGRPDVIALSTEGNRVDWYENPTWKSHPVARTARNIDLAVRDIDGDGRPEIALASGFNFSDSSRGGEIQWLEQPKEPDGLWATHPIAVDPVTHRLRWGDLDGDGRPELIHAPLFGRGSQGPASPTPAHLWAFRLPRDLRAGPWEPWKIDETLTVLHGIYVGDLNGDGREEILTASFEGIHRFDLDGKGEQARWTKTRISSGAAPRDPKPGAARGSSEVAPGKLGAKGASFIAAIEPWHGHELAIYTKAEKEGTWKRRVFDDSLEEGHALVVADFDGDGADEIVAGWRAGEGGLALYDSSDSSGDAWQRTLLDRKIAVEGAVAADINGDGRLDIVALAGRSNLLVWYENLGVRKP